MAARHLEPSLDGAPLEVCLALLSEDLKPGDFAAHLMAISENCREDQAMRLIADAFKLSNAAACLNEPENIATSLDLIRLAKERVRKLALMWLAPRTCPCCIAARRRLEGSNG